jgi:hypothetical protein
MRDNLRRAAVDWQLLELTWGDAAASDSFAAQANSKELKQIFRELRLFQAAGCPPDRTRGNPDLQLWNGGCPGEHTDTRFWVLKAKPSGWRLYFLAEEPRLILLYAVHKKTDERDPKDFRKCCRARDEYKRGTAIPEVLYVPPR